jgi:hypothetical protein
MATIEAPARAPLRFPFGFAIGIVIGVYLALLGFTFHESLVQEAPAKVSETSSVVVVPEATAVAPAQRLVPMAKEALNVNLGPGAAYGVLGTLPKGALIDVIPGERSGDWIAIRFPPNSSGRGWIPADGIEHVARDEEVAAGAATARPERVSEVMTTADETAANSETAAPPPTLGRRELAVLTAASAAVLVLVMVAFMLRQRAARPRFVWVSEAPPEATPGPATHHVRPPPESAGPETTPMPLIEAKENAMNPEVDQMPQGKAGADEVLQRGLGEFSEMLQGLTTSVCSALEKLSGDFRDAFSSFAEEQRAALQRQQALLEEAQRASNEAKGYAEQASLSASQSSSNQERAQELIAYLQKDREGLTVLVGDLRSRIAALSILAAPLPEANQSQQEAVVVPAGGEQRGEWSQ